MHREAVALDLARPVGRPASWSRPRRTPESPPFPHAPSREDERGAGRHRDRDPAPTRAQRPRRAAETANTAPESVAIVAPGGAFSSTDSTSPAIPSTATSATVIACHGARRLVQRRTVAAGTTTSAATSSAPSADSAATTTSATSASSTPSNSRPPHAQRTGRRRGRTRVASHCPPERQGRRERAGACDARQHQVARLDQQQAAEQQRLHSGAGLEHVAGQDHPERQHSGEADAVVASGPRRSRPASAATRSANAAAAPSAPERGGEAEPVGEHEAGEGGACRPHGSRRRGRAARSSSRGSRRRPRAAASPPAPRWTYGQVEGGRQGVHRGEVYQIMGTVLITITPSQRSMIGRREHAGHASAASGPSTPPASCAAQGTAAAARARR